jgi:hypothetical protein
MFFVFGYSKKYKYLKFIFLIFGIGLYSIHFSYSIYTGNLIIKNLRSLKPDIVEDIKIKPVIDRTFKSISLVAEVIIIKDKILIEKICSTLNKASYPLLPNRKPPYFWVSKLEIQTKTTKFSLCIYKMKISTAIVICSDDGRLHNLYSNELFSYKLDKIMESIISQ